MPVFEDSLKAITDECSSVAGTRGSTYADTWALPNQVSTFLDSILGVIGVHDLTPEQKRLILLASLVDVKDSRLLGGWHEDSVVDGCNYRMVLIALMREYRSRATQGPQGAS